MISVSKPRRSRDVAYADELARMGAPRHIIEQYETGADDDEAKNDSINVLTANWDAVRVFSTAEWKREIASSMAGTRLIAMGIESAEIKTVAQALRVDFCEDLLRRVRVMVAVARPLLNKT